MKIDSAFHFFVLFMALLTFGMPFGTLAQQLSVQAEAMNAAQRDAVARTNQNMWRAFGCFGGLFAVTGGYLYEPAPPPSALLGKSPEYVAFYADAYTLKAKNIQTRAAIEGCVASTCVTAALYGVLIILVAEESTSSRYYFY
ncbi:hypothetical protein F4009_21135 [Candidatus Poribacteria bacterium]|nr:hypothetical protein [Candidatus Poribacteria bacterium]MYH82715.1 hypothetical protein [Candidatus Poribacteria bacterium]MYK96467.1 hypothetical protein [Candidatus Poribacteria bacterium]